MCWRSLRSCLPIDDDFTKYLAQVFLSKPDNSVHPIYRDSHVHLMVDLLTLPGQASSNRVSAVSHQEDTLIPFVSKLYLIGGAALLH
ncbi:MAG: hypothetical protein RIF39_04405 [Cyclobacteriaceae bacterium]